MKSKDEILQKHCGGVEFLKPIELRYILDAMEEYANQYKSAALCSTNTCGECTKLNRTIAEIISAWEIEQEEIDKQLTLTF